MRKAIEDNEPRALFRSINDSGTCWQFFILPENEWLITCDDENVDSGSGDRASVLLGVKRFQRLASEQSADVTVDRTDALCG